jgi:hypothetical protein
MEPDNDQKKDAKKGFLLPGSPGSEGIVILTERIAG